MVRIGIGVVCVSLVGALGCNKTPEDPGLTATASASAGTSDTDMEESEGDEAMEDEDDGESATSTSGGPDPESSGGQNTTEPATTGDPACGDGTVVPGEQCDGMDLQGFDCASLGLGSGMLACDPLTCTFDTQMCMGNTSMGTSG